jgi:outer membrane protein OmpA-like peptidoglycan-associated protein
MTLQRVISIAAVTAAAMSLLATLGRADEPILTADQIAYELSTSKAVTGQAKVGLPMVTFAFNSAQLTPTARLQLDELAIALNYPAFKDLPFTVAGHTDAVGSDSYNKSLSERRAAAVGTYLAQQHGFPLSMMQEEGHGEAQLDPGLPPDASGQRRVEVSLRPGG